MATNVADVKEDPYLLTPEGIKDPPKGWAASLKYLGPGLILSASIVGSGELIATTTMGAKAGFALLWVVIFSTLVKVALQIELARWTIATGKPALTGYNDVPPKVGRLGWINLLWLVMAASKVVQVAGIMGGTAVAMSILIPIGGDPMGKTSIAAWVAILIVFSVAMLWSNRYGLIEKGAVTLVVIFSIVTIVIAAGLPFTQYAYGVNDVLSGLALQVPAGTLLLAVGMFGITGVGADEITFYTYWCVEKGYARWTGPNDGSPEWTERAKGWTKVMYKDALISWLVYTIGTVAFFIMGAAVLHPQNLVPQGNGMITTLSRIYTDIIGEWASVLFLIGAVAVLGSTMWASIPSHSRMWVNFLHTAKAVDWANPVQRLKWIRFFTVLLPILWGGLYLLTSNPVTLVLIGGVATSVFLVAVVVATWYLRNTQTPKQLWGGKGFNIALIISSIAIVAVGAATLFDLLT